MSRPVWASVVTYAYWRYVRTSRHALEPPTIVPVSRALAGLVTSTTERPTDVPTSASRLPPGEV